MESTHSDVRDQVVAALRIVLGARQTAAVIDDDTVPIDDLGLDSFDGVYVAMELEESLNCRIDNRLNPLKEDLTGGRSRPRSLGEIVAWIEVQIANSAKDHPQ